jgi:hypothetical protein
VVKALGITVMKPGGVFIPFRATADQRQSLWYDETGNADIITALTIQPTNRYLFTPPLQFDYVDSGARYNAVPATAPPPPEMQ